MLVDAEGAAVGAPGDGLLSLIESCDRARVTARDGIQISSLVRTDSWNLTGVGAVRGLRGRKSASWAGVW